MNYPRIYSLSTVGILKHYIHDYLFHPLRTDFIGPNGVGKSIIADLLQLIFIYDTDIIEFGTDGIQQEKRSIYKLPYGCSIAYCFLNIEVEENKFLIIGIAINQRVGMRIMPFVISKTADLSKPLSDLFLTKDQLLIAKDFLINNNTIPGLKELATELIQTRDLYLTYFKNKEEANRYYQFLYDKSVLSLNLSTGENLKAFAKVIQSFSRARTLDLSPAKASKSLKEFLFEDSDAELLEDYSSQQHTLDKLLRDYGSLDKYIKTLEQKQKRLFELKHFKEDAGLKKKAWWEGSLSDCYKSLVITRQTEKELKINLQKAKDLREELEKRKIKIPKIQQLIDEAIERASNDYDLQVDYEKLTQEVAKKEKEITELKLLNYPKLSEDWEKAVGKIDIEICATESIKECIIFATPIIRKYKELSAIENAREKQEKELQRLSQEFIKESEDTRKLIETIQSSSKDSFIQWVVKENKPLNKEQGSILLHYARWATSEHSDPKGGDRYLRPSEILYDAERSSLKDKKGFWLRLGAVKEFIELDNEAKLFEDPKQFDQSIAQLLQKLNKNQENLGLKLEEMDKVNKAKTYDKSILKYDFDLDLIDYRNIDKVKEAASCIMQLGEKITQLKNQKERDDEKLKLMLFKMPIGQETQEPELVKRELKIIASRQNKRNRDFAGFIAKEQSKIETTEKDISRLDAELLSTQEEIITEQENFNKLYNDYFNSFGENLTLEQLGEDHDNPTTLEAAADGAHQQFIIKYEGIISYFDETKEGISIPINMEVQSKTYSFRVLEEALLGSKINYTDDIAAALTDANASRLTMADDIKNSMVKIFDKTVSRYKKYRGLVQNINTFFKGQKISDRFYFRVDFFENKTIKIEFVEDIGARLRNAAKQGELPFDKPVSDFIEEFFRKVAKTKERLPIEKLLSPKTYFDLSVNLSDENGNEIPGSTGEAYSAIALLGIARLSLVQTDPKKGIRFIILEEIGNLDNSNFNTFPAIAKEYNYQILTMAPHPFKTSLADDWYAHHLIKGNVDPNINFHPTASYFKTKDRSEDLKTYLKLAGHELDRTESIK